MSINSSEDACTSPAENTLHIGGLLLAVSEAMDLISPSLQLHQQRAAYTAWQICRVMQIEPDSSARFFTAALLHDIGALTPEAKLALHDFEVHNTDQHCILGAVLFNQVSWLRPMAPVVRGHHTAWRSWETNGLSDDALGAQILLASDLLERLLKREKFSLAQAADLQDSMSRYAGSLLSPVVVEAFLEASSRTDFWEELTSTQISQLLRDLPPFSILTIHETNLAEFSNLLRGMIDFRSPFTAAHSAGVAACACALSAGLGYSDCEIAQMQMAGNMHDVGKLAVPNRIVEKNGRLTGREYAVMRQHAYYSYQILGAIEGFEEARQWAGYHHERLDGSGYPFMLKQDSLPLGARIMAVADIYTALTENRPYRQGTSPDRAAAHLKRDAFKGRIDPDVVNVLLHNHAEITGQVRKAQADSYANYENGIKPYL